jgi:DNA-binding PadR family transcriptional regulator
LCLGVLVHGDSSGYEIKKAFEEGALGHIQDASFSAIYPALARLHDEGLVTAKAIEQDGRPAKKVYSITPKGRMAFIDALIVPAEPDRLRSDFLFQMMFAQLLPARQVEAVIDARLADYAAKLAHMEDGCGHALMLTAGQRFVHGFGLAIYRAAQSYIEEHKHELLRESLLSERAVAE